MPAENDKALEACEMEMMGTESDCSYLPGRRSLMEYRFALSLSAERYEHLLERGWRRFGRTLFRPVCRMCSECRSLRVVIPEFKATKSQRKIRNKNTDVELKVGPVTVTDEHIDLYNRYHLDMHKRRGWPAREICADEFHDSFIDGEFPFTREFQYRLNGRMIGLGIVDMTGSVMSSIYFVHDPDLRDRALGTMSVLRELETGANNGQRVLYMGYYIRDCGSMNYKNRFGTHELLQDYAADGEPAVWQLPHGGGGEPGARESDAS